MSLAATHVLLALGGVFAGCVNIVAGGGSLITLPLLMLLGMPADVANGTGRLAIVTQSMAASVTFQRQGVLDRSRLGWVLVVALVGSLLGSVLATFLPASVIRWVIVGAMVGLTGFMVLFPRASFGEVGGTPAWATRPRAGLLGLLIAALYGGVIQGGVGFILLAVLGGILRYDVLRATALKLASTLIYGVVSLAVFAWAGKIAWLPACLLAGYNLVGSLLGVRLAMILPVAVLRWLIVVGALATAAVSILK